MPVFAFKGVAPEKIKEYSKKVGELAQIINCEVEKITFWSESAVSIDTGYVNNAIFVTIDWVGRPLKQEPVTKHILSFFEKESKHIYVKFNEINSFLYLNGECVG